MQPRCVRAFDATRRLAAEMSVLAGAEAKLPASPRILCFRLRSRLNSQCSAIHRDAVTQRILICV